MKKYNDIILEKFDANYSELILEKNVFKSYKEFQNRVLKEYGTQLYYVATFNSAIISLYPVVKQMLYNSNFNIHLSNYQIVLLTIFAIAEIIHVNNEAVKDIRRKIFKEKIEGYVEDVKKSLLSIQKIVKVIGRTIGITISFFIDMLAYVVLLVPINDALVEVLVEDGLDINTLSKKILGLGIGLGILFFKNLIIKIINILGFHAPEEVVVDAIEEEKKNK